ncbi:hypothetical protein H1R20_g1360, partial [Candolleomyces eurysporus]
MEREEEMKRREEEARREREKRTREREERERLQKAERERQQQQQSKGPSLGFGSWGGKIASSLFGGTSTEEPEPTQPPSQPWVDNKQDVNESALGWGSFGAKKKPSMSSIAKSAIGPSSLSRKPSQRSFQWGNNAGTTAPSPFDYAAPAHNTASSLFGDVNVNINFDESQGISLQDINFTNPALAAEQAKSSPPPPPPPKGDENPTADPWVIELTSTKGGKAGEDPTRTSTPVPETVAKKPEEEAAAADVDVDDAWGSVTSGKKKKGKKGKGLELANSEQPTREPSPAPGTPAEDAGGAPAQGAATSGNLQEDLVDLLGNEGGGEDNQAPAQTADAAEEWGIPVKTKKKKKKGNNPLEDDGTAASSPVDAGAAGGDDGGFTTMAAGKKKKGKKGR